MEGDRVHVVDLYQDILNFKQGKLRVSEYFTKMRAIWDEID